MSAPLLLQKQLPPKTARGRRVLDARLPTAQEPTKQALFLRSTTCSGLINDLMHDLHDLKKPDASFLSRKNEIRPFETASAASLEFLAQKADASFVFIGSSTKKRPDRLTMVRLFDGQILDQIELAIESFESLTKDQKTKCSLGVRHTWIFQGDAWEEEKLKGLQEMLLDCFHHRENEPIRLEDLETCIVCTANIDGSIHLRVFKIEGRKEGVELALMGPSLAFRIDRCMWASPELRQTALRQAKTDVNIPKKRKNIERDELGGKYGRVHVGKQDLGKLQTRKMKALKKNAKKE